MPSFQKGDLQDAICLLALTTERPRELDTVVSGLRSRHADINVSSTEEIDSLKKDANVNMDEQEERGNDEDIDMDFEVFEDGNATGDQQSLASLRNKVLDRLAEILARMKTDRARQTAAFLDPKHVSATYMVIRNQATAVDIFCSKNEGLDQRSHGGPGARKDDTDFLDSWKQLMQSISKQGPPVALLYRTFDDCL
ncbi:hypothetical protein E8E11_008031 [Didymella keratinophila]|nr:hypothetical protein E8E11_008031 [Didymella keratinophila]